MSEEKKELSKEEKLKLYPETEYFSVIDTIGVPHPYCITSKHVAFAADNFGGMLGEAAIIAAEKQGIRCGTPGCTLPYSEHKQAILVKCKIDDKTKLKEYVMSIKEQIIADGFDGVALLKGWKDEK